MTNVDIRVIIIGSLGFAAWLAIITGLVVWIAVAVQDYLGPRGQPVKLTELEAPDPLVPGRMARVKVTADKTRYCDPKVQIAFFDRRGVELRSVLMDWPYKEIGTSIAWPEFQVPNLAPGRYQIFVRGIWDCQDDDYLVASPFADAVVAPVE